MKNLPPNVMVQIFSYLEVKDKCRVAGVCKSWRELVGEKKLWKNVKFFPCRVDLATHWRALRRYFTDGLRKLHLRGFVYTSNETARCLTDAILKDICRRCPNLVELHVDEANLTSVDSGHLPPSLLALVLNRCITSPGWFQAGVAKGRLDRLRILNLKRSKEICDKDLEDLAFLPNGGKLRCINIAYCHRVTRRGFRSLADLINLYELDVSGTNIEDQDVDVITNKLRKLRIVNFQECDLLTSESAQALASLKYLATLFTAPYPYADEIDERRDAPIRSYRRRQILYDLFIFICLVIIFFIGCACIIMLYTEYHYSFLLEEKHFITLHLPN